MTTRPTIAVREYELDSEHRVQSQKDARIVDDMDQTAGAQASQTRRA